MITQKYKKILSEIHSNTKFGKRRKLPDFLEDFINDTQPATILDFGCGKGNLVETLKEKYTFRDIYGFDPANPEYDKNLVKVDLIVSTDVLEHIEPELLDQTLNEIKKHSKYIYHLISCAPAKLVLPDGRNAHVLLQDKFQWIETFEQHEHTIEEVFPYSIPDPNFNARERVCIWTRKLKDYTKR